EVVISESQRTKQRLSADGSQSYSDAAFRWSTRSVWNDGKLVTYVTILTVDRYGNEIRRQSLETRYVRADGVLVEEIILDTSPEFADTALGRPRVTLFKRGG